MRGRTSLAAALAFTAFGAVQLFAGVSGDTSLVELVKADNQQAAIALIDKHADVNTPLSDGSTALLWAAHNGDVELVDRLLKAGADAKAKNQFGATPMSEAAVLGNVAIIGKTAEGRRGSRFTERRRPDCADGGGAHR